MDSILRLVNGAGCCTGLQIESGVTMFLVYVFVVIPAHAGGVAQGGAVNGPEDGIQFRSREL